MPFKSRAQQGYLFAHKPKVAKEFAKHTPDGEYKQLPEHVGGAEEMLKLKKPSLVKFPRLAKLLGK